MNKKETPLTEFMAATAEEPAGSAKVAPSRRAKKVWLIYLDPDTSRRLRVAAALADRSMQAPGEEAADLLLQRYRSTHGGLDGRDARCVSRRPGAGGSRPVGAARRL